MKRKRKPTKAPAFRAPKSDRPTKGRQKDHLTRYINEEIE